MRNSIWENRAWCGLGRYGNQRNPGGVFLHQKPFYTSWVERLLARYTVKNDLWSQPLILEDCVQYGHVFSNIHGWYFTVHSTLKSDKWPEMCHLCQCKRLTYLWWGWKIKLRDYLYAANKILVENGEAKYFASRCVKLPSQQHLTSNFPPCLFSKGTSRDNCSFHDFTRLFLVVRKYVLIETFDI